MKIDKILRYARAVFNLHPSQVWRRILFRARMTIENSSPGLVGRLYRSESPPWSSGVRQAVAERLIELDLPDAAESDSILASWQFFQVGHIEFLHEVESFEGFPAWTRDGRDRLWDLNLHYFDYALDFVRLSVLSGDRSIADRTLAVIDDWIANYPLGSQHGWEPYAISLRVVNWLKIICLCENAVSSERIERISESIYQQCAYLASHIEYHLQGNHLLENFRTLIVASQIFDSPRSQKWGSDFRSQFLEELRKEVLGDGGHFERSPSYHCVVLDHVLDVLLFAQDVGSSFVSETKRLVQRMGNFLSAIPRVEHEFPLLNDCGANVSKPPDSVADRLRSYGIHCNPDDVRRRLATPGELSAYSLEDTGWYVVEWKDWLLLLDGGPMGPPNQPSHAHCDTLALLLYHRGMPVIVEAGTFGYYNDGAMRQYCRSARGHSTFIIDGQDHAEIWGSFRVGRRPRPSIREWKANTDGVLWVGEHDGYRHLPGRPVARRSVHFRQAAARRAVIRIVDNTIGRKPPNTIESFYHVGPSIEVQSSGTTVNLLDKSHKIASIESESSFEVGVSWFCPEFGLRIRNEVVNYRAGETLKCAISLCG